MFRVEFGTLLDFSDEDVIDGTLTIPEGVKKITGVTDYSCKNIAIKKLFCQNL